MNGILFPDEYFHVEKWKSFKGKYPPKSEVEHIIIIVYKKDNILKYFHVTSKIEKCRRVAKNDISSLVEIKKSEWNVLKKDSCIQCDEGHLNEISEKEFRKSYKKREVKPLGEIPDGVKKSIINAICTSVTFSEKEKVDFTVDTTFNQR